MRGLVPKSGVAASATTVVLAAVGVLVTGCGTDGTGVRDEGPVRSSSEPVSRSRTPSSSKVDAVELVRRDPKVDRQIRQDLEPCGDEGKYPVDVSYGKLTGGRSDDVVVNVMTCGDAVGIGTYVYRFVDGKYVHVFETETPPVYAEIDNGKLVVTQQFYGENDPVSYPSSEEVLTYGWADGRFTVRGRSQTDYSNVVGDPQNPAGN
ncbi:hypothetical protein HUT18_20020 [Streptomyces sp. NA04227]|uniref:hypothetical protein n=1 Tax=Streptomyces sp. NA04227 TaxID=2742136 RepID=UPI0015923C6E|nr:hypothetical protein [Streptomyces sp. NA04227]QKW08316.1 hypothetical protein HUT18_20020 [Streptomyces sp. NA04227]